MIINFQIYFLTKIKGETVIGITTVGILKPVINLNPSNFHNLDKIIIFISVLFRILQNIYDEAFCKNN